MRRRYGIPLMFLLAFAAMLAAPYFPFQPIYLVVWGTAIWAAIDSHKLEITQYDSSLAIPPLGVLIALVLFWPITFPWYLKLHWRIKNGEIGQKGGMSIIPFVIGGVFLLIVGAGAYLVWQAPMLMNLMTLSMSATAEYRDPVKVSYNGSDLELSMSDSKVPKDSTARVRVARGLATFALTRFSKPEKLKTVSVQLKNETQTAGVTVGRNANSFKWTVAQLRDSSKLGFAGGMSTDAPTVTPAGSPAKGSSTKSVVNRAAMSTAGASAGGAPATPAAPAPRRAPSAYARLRSADPTVRWDIRTTLFADFDCDNAPDTVVVGRRRTELHLGLARANNPEAQILIFDVGPGKESVSSAQAQVEIESLDFDPADKGHVTLAGFQRSGTCKGLTFGDDGKKKVHVFWSRQTQHLEWFQR